MRTNKIAYHRNGVAGNGFSVVLFNYRASGKTSKMVGVVFPERGNVAVLNTEMLVAGNITPGENSWRGDEFESDLRAALKEDSESQRVSVLKSEYDALRSELSGMVDRFERCATYAGSVPEMVQEATANARKVLGTTVSAIDAKLETVETI